MCKLLAISELARMENTSLFILKSVIKYVETVSGLVENI